MLPSDIRNLQEAYQNLYEESDLLTNDLIEEIVEELVEECLEFGYNLDESVAAVEAAAILYIDEAKVTYGSDTESPEQRSARAKDRLGDRKASARKAAVKGAVDRVKATAQGVKAAAGIAGSIAKDEVTRARRAASHSVQKKKAEVKGGIKKMIGGGLRAVAGGIGKVAQKAAGAASRLGEAKDDSYLETDMKKREKNNNDAINSMKKTDAHKSMAATAAKKLDENRAMARDPEGRKSGHSKQPDPSKPGFTGIGNMSISQIARMSAKIGKDKKQNEEVEIYDVVLEYLMSEGHADTIAEAEYIMTELDSEMVNQIIETRMDPRGRPASGPMNVYANPKKPSQAHSDAVKAYDAAQKKKTPEQRKAELDAYKERQMNR
jgi:hypothetical protein